MVGQAGTIARIDVRMACKLPGTSPASKSPRFPHIPQGELSHEAPSTRFHPDRVDDRRRDHRHPGRRGPAGVPDLHHQGQGFGSHSGHQPVPHGVAEVYQTGSQSSLPGINGWGCEASTEQSKYVQTVLTDADGLITVTLAAAPDLKDAASTTIKLVPPTPKARHWQPSASAQRPLARSSAARAARPASTRSTCRVHARTDSACLN